MTVATRPLTLEDAPRVAELLSANREFLAPWEPVRAEDYYTVEGQRAVTRALLEQHAQGRALPHVIVDPAGAVVGRITLNDIVRGPFLNAHLGYWLDQEHTGRGLATGAVRAISRLAFEELGLHRIQAGTLVDNLASQRVLERTGFVRFGLAPEYLNIAGRWQDHVLFQLVDPAAREASHTI